MRCLYISPSIIPSRTANSVHVINQTAAISSLGVETTLIAKRSIKNMSEFTENMKLIYGDGLYCTSCTYKTFYSRLNRATNILIAILALHYFLTSKKSDFIISRNLYASFVLAILFRQPIIFETHQLETGYKKKLQKILLLSKKVKTIVISEKLKEYLELHHQTKIRRPTIMHDAALADINPLCDKLSYKKQIMMDITSSQEWNCVCGYFGHLYAGRGIEIIQEAAKNRADTLFLVYGGNPEEVERKIEKNVLNNLFFLGHITYKEAQSLMQGFDILLMPYQERVSIGVKNQDTAKWMSPMKMFEYMASGVPIISSDLPVLHEVLTDNHNCLMVKPDDILAWINAIDRLINDSKLADQLSRNAYSDYKMKYTWTIRAKKILALAKKN